LGELVLVKAEQPEVVVHFAELGQLNGQQLIVPVRQGRGLVVGNAKGLDPLRRQVEGDVNRHLGQAQLQGCPIPGMADDHDAGFVDHDRLTELELLDGRRHGGDGGGAVVARVVLLRPD
jgi:hypothetical protein